MRLSDFDYELPPERIAQRPEARRDGSRLLVHDIGADRTEHTFIHDLARHLRPKDLLILNDTRVLPARVSARRQTGGRVELLFLEALGKNEGVWTAFANPAKKLRPGEVLSVPGTDVEVRLAERLVDEEGRAKKEWTACLARRGGEPDTQALLQVCGSMPLPPYVERDGESRDSLDALDRERYQTVFSRDEALGAIAAPTAGLHFTPELFEELEAHGVRRATVTLYVGAGTFVPVETDEIEDHQMHSERFELTQETVDAIERTRAQGGRVVCVGTTTVRVLESVAASGSLRATKGRTELFLRPGSTFHVTDALLTNFHLPRSTLLMLVSALAGRERILRLYAEAVERGYRFFSYGDAMLLTSSQARP